MAESIGNLFPTSIPSLTDNADIQAALRLYHYGENYDYNTNNTLNSSSVAGYLNSITVRVTALEGKGTGSKYVAESGLPATIPDGYIWVDSASSLGAQPGLVAAYQSTAPSTPVIGTLWVDSTSESALSLKVYNGTTWKVIV
jgi:hypothetical protein